MEINDIPAFKYQVRKLNVMWLAMVLSCLGAATPTLCMSPHPDKKQADQLVGFRKAGLTKDRSQIPALLVALKNPPERFYIFSALHALAQLGANEALPTVNTLIATSHDTSLVNYAVAAKARLLAESSAQAIKDPKARAQAKLNALYLEGGLSPGALTVTVKSYQVYARTPGVQVPVEFCVMREAADILYEDGVASSAVETAPPDYSLDPAAALKVQMAPLSPKDRIAALVGLLAHRKGYMPTEPYVIQLLADMGAPAEQAVDTEIVGMDLHQEEYDPGAFIALFNVLRATGDTSQSSFVQDFAHDLSRTAGPAAENVYADVLKGNKVLFASDY